MPLPAIPSTGTYSPVLGEAFLSPAEDAADVLGTECQMQLYEGIFNGRHYSNMITVSLNWGIALYVIRETGEYERVDKGPREPQRWSCSFKRSSDDVIVEEPEMKKAPMTGDVTVGTRQHGGIITFTDGREWKPQEEKEVPEFFRRSFETELLPATVDDGESPRPIKLFSSVKNVSAVDVTATNSVRPSRWVRGNKAVNVALLCTSFLGAAAFAGRGVYLVIYKREKRLDLCVHLAVSVLYFFVGFCEPLATILVREYSRASLEKLWTLRHSMKDVDEKSDVTFLQRAAVGQPIIVLVGLLAPAWLWYSHFFQVEETLRHFFILCNLLCWAGGMLFFGFAKIEEVGLIMVKEIVDVYSYRIRFRSYLRDCTWKELARQIIDFDGLLTEVFSIHALGGLWGLRASVLFGMSLVLCGLSLVHPALLMRLGCLVGGVCAGLGGALLLLKLARVTGRCSGTKPTNGFYSAMHSAVVHGSYPLTLDDKFHFDLLRQYITTRKIGIRLGGVMVTYQLVFSMAMRMCFYIPVAVSVTGSFLQGNNSTVSPQDGSFNALLHGSNSM
mmetsp:Transcript_34997/g.69122  ORF Transcript_34997/g.69122 Transcript_34997/m.69122 type:complete len:558 (-) Transcript_34997:35-1708(-)